MMNEKDAFGILNIQPGAVTKEDIKRAYHRAAALYHPDRNPAGLEMMKAVNLAYELLKDYVGTFEEGHQENYGEAINAALNAIVGLGLEIEICGSWLWVSGNTKPHREALKAAGFRWSPKKLCWYFRPAEYKSRNRKSWSMGQIRDSYGSENIKAGRYRQLGTAA